jgi:hypothetical protein
MTAAPNKRVQRTRYRSPLTRSPLGARKLFLVLPAVLFASIVGCAHDRWWQEFYARKSAWPIVVRAPGESCPLHHVQFVEFKVPITYGLVMGPPDTWRGRGYADSRWKAAESSFPFAVTPILGGCEMMTGAAQESTEFACAVCNEVQARWDRTHPQPW